MNKYSRKTRDEYQLITNYGHGDEIEVIEETLKEIRERKKEYLTNAQGLKSIRIVKKRVKIEEIKQ